MTQNELRDWIANNHLGIRGRGGALSADDANVVTQAMANAHGELEQLSVATWTLDDVPDFAIDGFGLLVKSRINAFGFEPDVRLEKYALDKLRYLTVDARHSVGKAEYF